MISKWTATHLAGLIALTSWLATHAWSADAPLVVEQFPITEAQKPKFEEMTRLQRELDKIGASYEAEINAWFKQAAEKFEQVKTNPSSSDWAMEREELLKKLNGIQQRKDPRIDQLRRQLDRTFRDNVQSLPPRGTR